jgi:hypothetical protein
MRNARYPYHLAKLVAARLSERGSEVPAHRVLLRLFETLYFASLNTDEGRACLCTVNYVDPAHRDDPAEEWPASRSQTVKFEYPQRLDVHTLTKLSEAADPSVSSFAVFCDDAGELVIWGMVDQERRYGDYIALDSPNEPKRPGLFQATIAGVGSISVYKDHALLASLEQHMLVQEYHDVLWSGPVHDLLRANLRDTLLSDAEALGDEKHPAAFLHVEQELLVRWQNAICRTLLNIQQYRHGGGLLIVPRFPARNTNVKHRLRYDRLPQALLGFVQHQLLRQQSMRKINEYCKEPAGGLLPWDLHSEAMQVHQKLDEHKSEVLGCVRFIASLSKVDGFVLMDKNLVLHGFGVELRSNSDVSDVYIAGDPQATKRLLRPAPLSSFGTRHRAMLRYCDEHAGSLGFVVSQDGDIRATMKVKDRLILWENINLQLAFKLENRAAAVGSLASLMGLMQFWAQSLSDMTGA